MGGGKQIYQENFLKGNNDSVTGGIRWVVLENGNDDSHSDSIESTYEDSTDSNATTFSSSDVVDDASSSSSKASSSSSYGPLYELSELMAQLPIKRGISKHYQGKSESFGCLASVKSLEDLAKKGYSFRKRVKPCNNNNKSKYSPKATISKKGTTKRVSFLTSSQVSSTTFLGTCRAPNPIHVQTHL